MADHAVADDYQGFLAHSGSASHTTKKAGASIPEGGKSMVRRQCQQQ